ncbi:MAG: acetoacetate--CoA ligase [Actinomycetota bacterium]|nr:acetoacetate--CoA ligase [Actinomycetota bacterium]
MGVAEGDVLWTPSDAGRAWVNVTRYMAWLREHRGLTLSTYDELWAWSVEDLEGFWASIWDYFDVGPPVDDHRVLPGGRAMPGARWFPGTDLNYAGHALRRRDDATAVVFRSEDGGARSLTFGELATRTAEVAAGLRRLGVGQGDRVVAYASNIPETLITFLATASLGAVWSACSPDFGLTAVLDRFRQIEPRVLLAVDGYRYKGVAYDRRPVIAEIAARLPTLETTVIVPLQAGDALPPGTMAFEDLAVPGAELAVEPVSFEHPLWVLYSSGTTGLPKAIVQGHGGIVLEHLKVLSLHHDLGPGDRFFWITSTGWMMWNLLVGGLLVGAAVVLYDGSPAHPDLGALWRMAEETGTTYFGASAPYVQACMKAGVVPREEADLSRLRGIGSTGAPLPPEGFEWVYANVAKDVLLGSVSGGTDVCTAFVGSCPLLPVRSGEIQCRCLGAKVEAFDAAGRSVVGDVGELVLTEPLPSMPLRLWGDEEDRRYRASYFEHFPAVWRHGDWIKITERGSCVISGRSDSTLNRGGVRIGTSELYRVVEALPDVADSLVVDCGRLLLFVVPTEGAALDDPLRARIAGAVRAELSPRHLPDEIVAIDEVPRTLNGKKLEVPVKRILLGEDPGAVVSPDAMANPASLRVFVELAALR